jgi:hypothetical protein
MTTYLSEAAVLLGAMVSIDGEISAVSTPEAARALGLTPGLATAVIQEVVALGLVEVADATVRPTLAGLAMGVSLAQAAGEARAHNARIAGGPYWTYLPGGVT